MLINDYVETINFKAIIACGWIFLYVVNDGWLHTYQSFSDETLDGRKDLTVVDTHLLVGGLKLLEVPFRAVCFIFALGLIDVTFVVLYKFCAFFVDTKVCQVDVFVIYVFRV